MKNTKILNKKETMVLVALNSAANLSTGGQFGHLNDVNRCGLTHNEFSGYISALQKKSIFEYLDNTSNDHYRGQYAINEEYKQTIS